MRPAILLIALKMTLLSLFAAPPAAGETLVPKAPEASLSVLTYNTFLRAPLWMFPDDHDARAPAMPPHLEGFDLVVLQEAFSPPHRALILARLAHAYPHRSQVLGIDEFMSQNGGVVVLSRWPIVREAQLEFDDCRWPDCMVKKGAIYVELDADGTRYHLFGLHMQAEREFGATRALQLRQLKTFVDAQQIPASEPIVIAGDFNIDYLSRDADGEFDTLRRTLQARPIGDDLAPSFDDASNSMLTEPYRERLDYILFVDDHRQPDSGTTAVTLIRDGARDLSDHHGVAGRFRFAPR